MSNRDEQPVRRLAVLTFLTLDGVMQAPAHRDEDRTGGFAHGGWAAEHWDEVMPQAAEEAMAEPYDLLLGRRTYEAFASHWPHVTGDPVAERLNAARKFVCTSTRDRLDWNNSVPIAGDATTEVSRLKRQAGPLLQVHGSWQLVQALLRAGLVDELRLWTFPVVVGSGKRLFDGGAEPSALTLVKTRTTSSGVLMGIYER